jgi:hypothetical protein
MATLKFRVPVFATPPVESATRITVAYVPDALGVPLIRPVDELRVKPGGKEPENNENVKEELPPEELSCSEKE